jgi:hypothetical protein
MLDLNTSGQLRAPTALIPRKENFFSLGKKLSATNAGLGSAGKNAVLGIEALMARP